MHERGFHLNLDAALKLIFTGTSREALGIMIDDGYLSRFPIPFRARERNHQNSGEIGRSLIESDFPEHSLLLSRLGRAMPNWE